MLFYHMNVDQRCVLCRSSNEDTEHLFTACPYAYIIMLACPFSPVINWRRWMQGDFFSGQHTTFEKHVAFLYINVAIYLIWKERNDRIHDKGSMPVTQLGVLVKRMVRERLFTCKSFRRQLVRDPSLSRILY